MLTEKFHDVIKIHMQRMYYEGIISIKIFLSYMNAYLIAPLKVNSESKRNIKFYFEHSL